MEPALIVLVVLACLRRSSSPSRTIRIIPQARAGVVERLGRYQPHARPGPDDRRPVRRPRAPADRPARAGRDLPAAAGDHRGQRRRCRSTPSSTSRSPTRRRPPTRSPTRSQAIEQLTVTTLRNVIGGLTLEETLTSRDNINSAAARRARRGDRQVGHPRQPRRAQVDRPARLDPGGDGEADARRARPPRGDPHRRGRQAVADPHRRGREAGGGAARPRAPRRRRSCAPRARRRRSRRSSQAIHEGDARPAAARLPVPADAAAARAGRGEQGLRHPERVHPGARAASAALAAAPGGAPRSRRGPPAAAPPGDPPGPATASSRWQPEPRRCSTPSPRSSRTPSPTSARAAR